MIVVHIAKVYIIYWPDFICNVNVIQYCMTPWPTLPVTVGMSKNPLDGGCLMPKVSISQIINTNPNSALWFYQSNFKVFQSNIAFKISEHYISTFYFSSRLNFIHAAICGISNTCLISAFNITFSLKWISKALCKIKKF